MGLVAGVGLLIGYGVGVFVTYTMFKKQAMKKGVWSELNSKNEAEE